MVNRRFWGWRLFGLLVPWLAWGVAPANHAQAQDPGAMRIALEALVANSDDVVLVQGKEVRTGGGGAGDSDAVVFEVLANLRQAFDPYHPESLTPGPNAEAEAGAQAAVHSELVLPAKSLRLDGQYYWADQLQDPASVLPPELFADGERMFVVFQNYGKLDPPIHVIVDFEQGVVSAEWQWFSGKEAVLKATQTCLAAYRGTESLRTVKLTTGYFNTAISRVNVNASYDDEVFGRWIIFPCDNHYGELVLESAMDPAALNNAHAIDQGSHWLHCVQTLRYFPSTEAENRVRAVIDDAAVADAPKQVLQELLKVWDSDGATVSGR